MTERPIIFSAPMVRAILAGRKTQTRRIVKWQRNEDLNLSFSSLEPENIGGNRWTLSSRDGMGCWNVRAHAHCPFGVPGDRLWVREAHAFTTGIDSAPLNTVIYRADDPSDQWAWNRKSRQDTPRSPWRPSIHMPRWASRITLEVERIRVQRVQDISDEDIEKEGIGASRVVAGDARCGCSWRYGVDGKHFALSPDQAFSELWDSIHGPGAWDRNDWVWAVTFRRVERGL